MKYARVFENIQTRKTAQKYFSNRSELSITSGLVLKVQVNGSSKSSMRLMQTLSTDKVDTKVREGYIAEEGISQDVDFCAFASVIKIQL